MPAYSVLVIFLSFVLWQVRCVLVKTGNNSENEKEINATFVDVEIKVDAVNFRGLAIYNSSVWVGGSDGQVVRLKGEGQMHGQIESAKEYELRDIAIFDEAEIVMLGSGSMARIFSYVKETGDFKTVYENNNNASFLNCMDFWENGKGVAFGDVIKGKALILLTDDKGQTWREASAESIPEAVEGEVGFAASGTSLVTGEEGKAWIGLGGGSKGSKARVLMTSDYGSTWTAVETTLEAGGKTAGIFSLAVQGEKLVAVGGDFSQPGQSSRRAVSISKDGGLTWAEPESPTYGYRSCVIFVGNDELLAVGTNGLDFSADGGKNWQNVKNGKTKLGWNTISLDPQTGVFWIVGSDSTVVKMYLKY